jgi:hypothetical protein
MITTPTKPIRRAPAPTRADEPTREIGRPHDPADLAATLRDLAVRAHRAARAVDAASSPAGDAATACESLCELARLHPRIVELQRSVEAGPDRGLASYLAALRRAVESRLG